MVCSLLVDEETQASLDILKDDENVTLLPFPQIRNHWRNTHVARLREENSLTWFFTTFPLLQRPQEGYKLVRTM